LISITTLIVEGDTKCGRRPAVTPVDGQCIVKATGADCFCVGDAGVEGSGEAAWPPHALSARAPAIARYETRLN
jgi:hypothetical protein